jgi:hypothetical protein
LEQETAHSENSELNDDDNEDLESPHSFEVLAPSVGACDSNAQAKESTYINEVVHKPDDTRFRAAISKEIEGLMKREVFEVVEATSVHPRSNVMGSKFHLVIKNSGVENQTFKASLVIFGTMDSQKNQILSEAQLPLAK